MLDRPKSTLKQTCLSGSEESKQQSLTERDNLPDDDAVGPDVGLGGVGALLE